jgi:hypothetical protein
VLDNYCWEASLSRIRERLTYANVAATLALFFALGGGAAYATHLVVRSSDIVDNQVKSSDVRDDSLTGGGLLGEDIREETLGAVPSAQNADQLDSLDSGDFLRSNGKAADAEQLDGRDSSQFIQGSGVAGGGARAITPGSFPTVLQMNDPGIRLAYSCPASNITTTNGILRIRNIGTQTVNLFSDNGGNNPNHFGSLPPDGAFDQSAAAPGEMITFGVQGSYIAMVTVFSVHRASDTTCHMQSQATVTR